MTTTHERNLEMALDLLKKKEKELNDERRVSAAMAADNRELRRQNAVLAERLTETATEVRHLDEIVEHHLATTARR